jgi:hypothetical protein
LELATGGIVEVEAQMKEYYPPMVTVNPDFIPGELPPDDRKPMVKRHYLIKIIPSDCMSGKEFEAPAGWDLFCLWSHDGSTYGVFERVEEL